MPLIKYSPLVTTMRGTQGGGIYSRNHAGDILKSWAKPRNPISAYSRVNRNSWQYLIQDWKNLTQNQRKQWEAAAKNITWYNKLSEAYHPTGQLLYLSYSQNIFLTGNTPTGSYVEPNQFKAISNISLTPFDDTYNNIFLNFTEINPVGTIAYLIFSTPPLSTGINYAYKYFRMIGIILSGTGSPVDIISWYSNRFGRIYSNEKIFIKIRPIEIASGSQGIEVFCNTIVNNSGSTPMLIGMLDYSYTFL